MLGSQGDGDGHNHAWLFLPLSLLPSFWARVTVGASEGQVQLNSHPISAWTCMYFQTHLWRGSQKRGIRCHQGGRAQTKGCTWGSGPFPSQCVSETSLSVRTLQTQGPTLADLVTLHPSSVLLFGGGPEDFDVCRRQTSGRDAGRRFGGLCRRVRKRFYYVSRVRTGLQGPAPRGAGSPWLQSRPQWHWSRPSFHRAALSGSREGVLMARVVKRLVQSLRFYIWGQVEERHRNDLSRSPEFS